MANNWGPLWALAGEWEGVGGLDSAFAHAHGKVDETPFREQARFSPVGPVDNGSQHLYALSYRSEMWRMNEDASFHTETGYWLWDGATDEILRAFVVPRGIAVLAGGTAGADATEFTMRAANGEEPYSIGENRYLAAHASTVSYEVKITIGSDTWSYDETTMLKMNEIDGLFPHTDHNTLTRVGPAPAPPA